ncbi:MAG TPA: hypothetical protein VMT81_00830 [Candidatus Paceibacterota bacterium]|nr:hypothetical protein [Candidatus Paceibacterota bacterium]
MTTTPSNRNGFIQRLAAAWIQEIGLRGFVGHPEQLFEHAEVVKRINRLRPATLGVLAWQGIARKDTGVGQKAEGRTCLYDVHNGTWISKYAGGKDALRTLAQTAVVCEMWDQLGRPYEDWHARTERLAEEEFDRGMRDYVHHGGKVSTRQ